VGRESHRLPWWRRFAELPALGAPSTPLEAMARRLRSPEGRAVYALRKQAVEPVFGIFKSTINFRQFSMRGVDKARGEWSRVTMSWKIEHMFTPQTSLIWCRTRSNSASLPRPSCCSTSPHSLTGCAQ
jgi:hypothetical protein